DQRGRPMGTALLEDPVAAVRSLPDREVLTEESDSLDRPLVQLAGEGHRIPVAAHQFAHGCTGAHAGERLVQLFGQHASFSSAKDGDRAAGAVNADPLAGLDVTGG